MSSLRVKVDLGGVLLALVVVLGQVGQFLKRGGADIFTLVCIYFHDSKGVNPSCGRRKIWLLP